MKALRMLIALIFCSAAALAQDLNARVQILAPQISNSNTRVFEVLQTNIRDFLNGRKWSNDAIQPAERIDCNFVITITEWDGASSFKSKAQIVSSRPVYGTSYNSPVLTINDEDFDFSYTEGQPLDYSDQNYINNLSSLLAFYAYIITGLDYDTFSKYGGNPYFARALTVVNNAQSAGFKGWKAFEGLRNRFWLCENVNNKIYEPIRETLYEYHRLGLDIMQDNASKGRKAILDILPLLERFDKQKQGSMLNQLFFTAKSDELVNLLSAASPQEKIKAYNILTVADPANLIKYEALKK